MNCQLLLPHINPLLAENSGYRSTNGPASAPAEDNRHSEACSSKPSQERLDELLLIHEYERQRLGQELHDSAGQLVVSLLLSLGRLRQLDKGDRQGGVIDEIERTARQIDNEIRSLAFLHYQAELGDRSLSACLESLARGFGRRTGIRTSFRCLGGTPLADELLSTVLLRVTQEALVNVHRHAHAKSASVELRSRSGCLELRISDDGIGMSEADATAQSCGIGLQGMRHRVEACGGSFEIRNLKHGTMIRAVFPVAIER
jgi:two-component system, NarL family, sensor kinase